MIFPAELHEWLAIGDLSRLTRRLLDVCESATAPDDLLQDALALRKAYNSFAILPASAAAEAEKNALQAQAATVVARVVAWMTGNAPAAAPPARIMFQGTGITKHFHTPKYHFSLPQMDVTLRAGEITGIVGENGNGKTTLLRIIAGDLAADGGELRYPEILPTGWDWYKIRQQIGYISQHIQPWNGYLRENLAFSAAVHGIRGRANERAVDFIIQRLGLTRYAEAMWSEISGGYKLRFELARALVWRPRLLVIDEPMAHLDINTQQLFLQDLRYLADSPNFPLAIALSSQHLHEVERISDNIIFIKNGEALYNGKMQEFAADRTENLYELHTPADLAQLQRVFAEMPNITFEASPAAILLRTPTDVASFHLLEILARHQITITYFRDISTSTSRLFR